jgi:FAD/FMN-containing dehydrogenase
MQSRWPDVAWPVEYRTLKADDAYLSPAHGRDTVTISIHQDARLPYREFFEDIEPIFVAHQGRPHWGKVNTLGRDQLTALYPRWNEFRAIRHRYDPNGTFLNEYLRSLFL